ncbi:MAG: cytochrome d ubiquinol oxidase subunit II [Rhizomicrobium sp.]
MITFWVVALGLTILLYVLLDGFDLGVGILHLFNRDEADRRRMLAAVSPVWDGNETWLVLTGTILFGAFSKVFALALSAFYLPVLVGICALVLRGVAFEFRSKATRTRRLWDVAFGAGSLVAAFVQGAAVGALVRGLPIENGVYTGGAFGWLSGYSVLCGAGLCVAYALLGAGWLAAKCDGDLRDKAFALLPRLLLGLLLFLAVAVAAALAAGLPIMGRWIERPYLAVFPLLGAAAAWGLLDGVAKRRDLRPFLMGGLIFTAAFGAVAVSFWPYMVPFAITVDEAASPPQSLWFMFWGAGLIALPLTLAYTAFAYRVFGGKIADSAAYDE